MVSIQAITNRENIPVVACRCTTNESQSVYDMVYSINEGYYNTLIESIKTSHVDRQFQQFSSIDMGLNFLLKMSDKFAKLLSHETRQVDLKLAACIRAMKEDPTKTYQYRQYLINNIQYRFPRLDGKLISNLDILSSAKKALEHNASISINQAEYSVDDWIRDNSTQELMARHLEREAPISIDEGVYSVKQLVAMISLFHKEAVKYYDTLKDDIKQSQQDMKDLRDKTITLKKQLLSSKTVLSDDGIKKAKLFFEEYESFLTKIAERISVYHRSIIWLYGKNISYIMETVQKMYDDIPQEYIKDNIFQNYAKKDLFDEIDRLLS